MKNCLSRLKQLSWKFEYAGAPAVEQSIMEAVSACGKYSIKNGSGQMVFITLMFAIGHGSPLTHCFLGSRAP